MVATMFYLVLMITYFAPTSNAANLAFTAAYNTDKLYMATIPDSATYYNSTEVLSLNFTKLVDTGDKPRSIAYDPFDEKVYWIEYADDMIGRCDLDGSNVEKYATSNSPWGIVLDIVNRTILFSDYTTEGVSKLAIADFNTPGAATLIANTVQAPTLKNPRQIGFLPIQNILGVTYSDGTEVWEYNNSGDATGRFAFNSGLTKPSGLYLGVEGLFVSDTDGKKIIARRAIDNKIFDVFQGSGTDAPRGMDIFGENLYFCNFGRDSIYSVPWYSDVASPKVELEYTLDDGDTLDGCTDVHFYRETSVNFEETEIGPVCENTTLSISITNYGSNVHVVFGVTTDGTAVSGTDFEDKSEAYGDLDETVLLPAGQTEIYELSIYNNAICDTIERTFEIRLLDIYGVPVKTGNNTATVTIATDFECGNTIVPFFPVYPVIREIWFGGFNIDFEIPINDTVKTWTMRLHFRRRAYSLLIEGCTAETMLESTTSRRIKGGKSSTHLVTPHPSKASYCPGDVLRLTIVGKTWAKKQPDLVKGMTAELSMVIL